MLATGSCSTRESDRIRAEKLAHDIDRAAIDARVIALFDNGSLRSHVRKLEKVELASVWRLTLQVLAREHARAVEPLSPIEVHRRLLEGLAGESLLVSSAMFLSKLADAEKFFGLSFKTIKARQGGFLDTAASERAMRAARATMTAAEVLGSYDAARAYMHTRNFALGGATPAELLKTSDGERIVLDELHTQAEGGPL
jgi:putative toxin-antitoxin system antitoxin component (TIGR02293 family)